MIYSIPLIGTSLDFESNLSLSTNLLSAAAIKLPAFLDHTFYFTFTKATAPVATIRTSTNFLKLVRWDGTQVGPYNVTTAALSAGSWGAAPVSPYNSVTAIKLVCIVPCDSAGVTSGDITSISISTFQTVGSLSAFGLSALTTLTIPSSNTLSSFNGKGLANLQAFAYDSTTTGTLYEFSGIGLTSLSSLSLNNQQLRSFNSTEMNNLVSLSLPSNLNLPSLYCYNLNKLETLNVYNNTNMLVLDLYGASSLTSLSAHNLLNLQSSLTLNDTPNITYMNVGGNSKLNNTFDSITANYLTNLDAAGCNINCFNNNLFPKLTGSSQSSPINLSLKSSGTFNNNNIPALSASITVGCPDYNTFYNSFSNNNLSSLNALTLSQQTYITDEQPLSAKPFNFSNNDLRNLTLLQLPYYNVGYNIVENNNFSNLRDLSFELSPILSFNNNNNNIFLKLSALYFQGSLETFNNNNLPTLSALYLFSNIKSFSNNNLSAVQGQRTSTSSWSGSVPRIDPLTIYGTNLSSFENNDLRSLQYLIMSSFRKLKSLPLVSNRLDSLIELTNYNSTITEFTNLTADNLVNLYYNPFNPTTFSNNSLPKLLKLWRTAGDSIATATTIAYFNNNNLPSYMLFNSSQGSTWNNLVEFTGNNISKGAGGLNFQAPYLSAFNNNNLSKASNLNIYDSFSRRGLMSVCNNNLSSASTLSIAADLYLLSGNNFSGVTSLTLSRLQSTSLDLSSAGFNESTLNNLNFTDTKLSSLDISRTNPTQVAVFNNTELSTIYFKATAARSLTLNLYDNPKLKFDFNTLSAAAACTLTVGSQALTSIDLSKIANLVSFTSQGNYISSFDTTGLSNLTNLVLSQNHLTHLNAAGLTNPSLNTTFNLSNNRFTSLNIDSIGKLNKIQDLNISSNKFSVLNCSEFRPLTSLHILNVSNNPLTALTNTTALTSLPALNIIYISSTLLSALSLPYISSLHTLLVDNTPTLTFLNTSQLGSLLYLTASNTGLTSLYTPSLSSLQQLTVSESQFTTLSTDGMPNLYYLAANNMPNLTSLRLVGNLQIIYISENYNLTDLTFVNATIGDNYIGTIVVNDCNLTSQSLNNLYNALGTAGYGKKGSGTLEVSQNPGFANSNTSIAIAKGWNIA